MRKPCVMGCITIEPGGKGKGFLQATNRPGGEPLGLPWMLVHGVEDGPTFTIVSGVHGDEYEGGEAVRWTWQNLDPAKLRGTFIGVPTVNVPAFEIGSRLSSIDHVNLGRIFPGKESGGTSERIAHTLFAKVVTRSDYLIDAHGGGVDLIHIRVANYREVEDAVLNRRTFELAKATGLGWLGGYGKVGSGSLPDEAMKKGVAAITIEVGGEGRCREEDVARCTQVIANALKYADMIDGDPVMPETQTIMHAAVALTVNYSGLFRHRPDLQPTCFVKKGETIGTVSDLLGDVLETVIAPHDGVLISLRSYPTIRTGEWIGWLGRDLEQVARPERSKLGSAAG